MLVGLAAVISSTTAGAYTLTGKTWPAGSNVVMQMSLGNSALPLLDGSGNSRNNAAAPALDMWNAQMGRIQFGRVMNSTAPSSSGDRVNSVVFSNSVFGQSFGVGTLAVTYYIMSGNNLVEADILFNTAQTFDSYRGPLQWGGNGYAIGDLRRVFLHELGHALGLNHSWADSIMSESTSDRETLSSDDVAGLQAMYGAPVVQPTPTPTPTPPPAQGSGVRGDFNRDGKPDLIWQNHATGERAIWMMNGSAWGGERFLPTVSTQWYIAATADFNGDGHSDLVWQNNVTGQATIWVMNEATQIDHWWLPTVPTEWQIAAAGDFSGDGKTDIVWQNINTGQRAVWLMDAGNWIGERWLPQVSTDWRIAASADFNNDGHLDLVWQNIVSGQRAVWLMNRTTWAAERWLPQIPTDWQIVAAADYSGDNQADLVWQNRNSGQRAIWVMNGTAWAGERWLPTIPTTWEIRNR